MKQRGALIPILIFCMAFQLNFQKVILSFLGDNYNIYTKLWCLIPIFLLIRYSPGLFRRAHKDLISFATIWFLIILFMHAVVQMVTWGSGIVAVWSFFAYGIWIGVFAWCLQMRLTIVLRLASFIFIFLGLINGGSVLYEYFIGQALMKTYISTIGDINRYYGISTSMSILGLQLAVGIIGAMHSLFSFRAILTRLVMFGIIMFQAFALFVTSSRGPMIYLLLSLLLLFLFRCYSKRQWFLYSCITIFCVAGFFMFDYEYSKLSFLYDALSLSDVSNQVRLNTYAESISLFNREWWVPLVGYGSGALTHIPHYMSQPEFYSESSVIKCILEIGLIGTIPFLLCLAVLGLSFVVRRHSVVLKRHMEFFAILLLILLQCLTHETFKTWIGSFYLVLSLGVCARLLREARARAVRITGNYCNGADFYDR